MNLLTTNKIGKEEDERWSGESQSTEEGGVLIEQGNISSNVKFDTAPHNKHVNISPAQCIFTLKGDGS